MKRIIIFGSVPVARKCLQICLGNRDIKIVGVVTEKNYIPTWSTEETVYSFAVINNIKIIKMSELKDLKYDIGFSIRFNKIIKKEIIDLFPEGIINIHGGPLPYYRSVNFIMVKAYWNIGKLIVEEEQKGKRKGRRKRNLMPFCARNTRRGGRGKSL